jgi:Fe-Mn family superoxide dismutase
MKLLLAPNGKPSNLTPEQYRLVRTPAFKAWFGDWENSPETASKVIDENGEPLVVLHGSPMGITTEFSMDKGVVKSSGLMEYGMYFTTNRKLARLYQLAKQIEKTDEWKNKLKALEEKQSRVRNNIEYDKLSKEIDLMLYGRIYEVFLNLRKIKTFDGKGMSGIDAYRNLEVDAGYDIKTGREAMNLLRKGYIGWNDFRQKRIVEKVNGIKAENIVELSEDSDKYKYWKDDYIGTTYLVFPNEEGKFNNIKLADGSNTTFDGNNPDIRYADGGSITDLLSSQEVADKLGRELHWWNDDIVYLSGIEYKKVYLRPEYKKVKIKIDIMYKPVLLPYSYSDLEPSIDAETMNVHYNKHYLGYLNNLNDEFKKYDLPILPIQTLIKNIDDFSQNIRNNAGGYYNHSLFWKMLTPINNKSNNLPIGISKNIIDRDFGSFEMFKKLIENTAKKRFGSGWVWWIVMPNGQTRIVETPYQDNPQMYYDCHILLGIDVWEHAYYLKYKADRMKYVNNIFDIINWDYCNKILSLFLYRK